MERSDLIVERNGPVWLAVLNRPDRLNALDARLAYELIALFDQVNQDPSVGALVLTGAGDAFCAGASVRTALPAALVAAVSAPTGGPCTVGIPTVAPPT